MDMFSKLGVTPITTQSSVLVSSSKYLDHPLLGDALATALLRRNGPDRRVGWDSTPIVRAFWDVRDKDRSNRLLAEHRRADPAFDAWMEERFISTFTRDDLAGYAPGTLGRIFHDYIVAGDLDIAIDPRLRADPAWRPVTDLDYWELRSAQTHDFEHILGGVAFTAMAEVVPFWMRIENWNRNLPAVLAGELTALQMLLILPMLSRTMLHYPHAYPMLSDFMQRGLALGGVAKPLFMVRYEPLFGLSLDEARAAIGLPPVEFYDSDAMSDYFHEKTPAPLSVQAAA